MRKPTGIPESEKSPVVGVVGGIDGVSAAFGHKTEPNIEASADDEHDERHADENDPEPLDRLFR